MSVARVTEISSTSQTSFEDAIRQGVTRASATLRHVTGAWIKEQRIDIRDGQITNFQVNMLVSSCSRAHRPRHRSVRLRARSGSHS